MPRTSDSQTAVIDRLDVARRAHNTFVLGVGLAAVDVLAVFAFLLARAPLAGLVVIVLAVAGNLAGAFLSRRGAGDQAGATLVGISIVTLIGANAITGQLFEVHAFIWVPIAIAAATLPRPGIIMTAVLTALLSIGLALATPLQEETVAVGLLGAGGVVLSLTAGVLGVIQSDSARHFIGLATRQAAETDLARKSAADVEARYRLVADHSSQLIALQDGAGRPVFASPSFQRVLARTPGTDGVTDLATLVAAEDRPSHLAASEQALRTGSGRATLRLVDADGRARAFDVEYQRIDQDGERLLAFSGSDIGTQLELVAQLEQAQKVESLGILASSIAHDFNNMVMVIDTGVEGARAAAEAGQPADEALESIAAASRSAAELARQLLSFARRAPAAADRIVVGEVVAAFAPLLKRIAGPRIRVETRIEPCADTVRCSRVELEQIALNLVVNARDAMPNGGSIRLEVRPRPSASGADGTSIGPAMELSVADTGAGMDAATLARVFEPFFTTKAAGSGTGLGLPSSLGIARRLGGDLTVESEPGRGSTFRLVLPREPPA